MTLLSHAFPTEESISQPPLPENATLRVDTFGAYSLHGILSGYHINILRGFLNRCSDILPSPFQNFQLLKELKVKLD